MPTFTEEQLKRTILNPLSDQLLGINNGEDYKPLKQF